MEEKKAAMDVLNAIESRRSVAAMADKAVSDDVIAELIRYAEMAPQHKKTAPWRFKVFNGVAKQELQQAWEAGITARGEGVAKVVGKTDRAPAIVAVWCAVGQGEKQVPAWEEYAAVAAAIQNMLLAAQAFGLGTFWRSGNVGELPEVTALLDGFDAGRGDIVLGFIYVGYPAA